MKDKVDYFRKLIELMQLLRSPEGCPWDREQTRETLKPMLIEEAHEVLDAIDTEDPDELCEELGDLLFQVIFHCQLSAELEEFDIDDVCRRVYEKMVHRHPHVFGDMKIADSDELLRNWEDLKAAEKARMGKKPPVSKSLLDGIPKGLPPMYTTYQITSKAARVGFDWEDIEGIRDKFLEEFEELQEALAEQDPRKVQEEVGDLVFAALNIARYLEIDPGTALKRSNEKFVRRFQGMEREFEANGVSMRDATIDQLEAAWQGQKAKTRPAEEYENRDE